MSSQPATMPGELEPGLEMKQGMERQIPGLEPAMAVAGGGFAPRRECANPALIAGERGKSANNQNMNMRDRLLNTRGGQALTALVAAGALGGAIAASAEASSTEQPETTTMVNIGGSKVPAVAMAGGKIEVIANHRDKSISRADIREARQDGKCKVYSPEEAIEAGIVTQGYNNSGVHYAPENRRSTICRIDGKLIRIECRNKAKITQKPRPAKAKLTAWINNWNKAKIRLKSVSKVFVGGECKTPDGNATARAGAYARAVSSIRMKWKNVAKAGAKVTTRRFARVKARTERRSEFKLKNKTNVYAKAIAICKQVGGKFVPEKPEEKPPKDGTDTTPPPTEAPGPNPDPSPEEPYPGGYQCYDEITGEPEEPRSDGTCKPGDVGSF